MAPRCGFHAKRLVILLLVSAWLSGFITKARADVHGWSEAYGTDAAMRRINTWLVCGTFPVKDEAAFERSLFDEAAVEPNPGAVSGGKPWRFCDDRLYCRNLDDYVDLYTFFNEVRPGSPGEPTEFSAAYAHTYVWSPAEQQISILIGANDGYRVWVNGAVVGSSFSRMRTAARDEDTLPATLKEGWNRLLVKVQNAQGRWGFYLKLADGAGRSINGLEYSVEKPDGELAIVTGELPTGYTLQPYVWLTVAELTPAPKIPSASPLRFQAKGGQPPYFWSIPENGRCLPPGLFMDQVEGEIRGFCSGQTGSYVFTLEVKDAAGITARRELAIEVAERPTRWLELNQIGGLIHAGNLGGKWLHGEPELQAKTMQREGYSYAAQTTAWMIQQEAWPGFFDAERFKANSEQLKAADGFVDHKGIRHQDVSEYVKTWRAHGIRFGSYVGLPDPVAMVFDPKNPDFTLWPRFLDCLHNHFESLCVRYRPAVLYLDSAVIPYQGKYDWDFDAMYSLIKTLSPETLVLVNASNVYLAGDSDIYSFENAPEPPYCWARWPRGRSGLNPKFQPCSTWRYPFNWANWPAGRPRDPGMENDTDHLDWAEWCQVVVSLIGEGYLVDLDHTQDALRQPMHEKIGDWLHPRLVSLLGTVPGPLRDEPWGYSVQRGITIYLHILETRRGKTGMPEGGRLSVGPLTEPIARAYLVPSNDPVEFTREGDQVLLDLGKVVPDEIDTIVALELGAGMVSADSAP